MFLLFSFINLPFYVAVVIYLKYSLRFWGCQADYSHS